MFSVRRSFVFSVQRLVFFPHTKYDTNLVENGTACHVSGFLVPGQFGVHSRIRVLGELRVVCRSSRMHVPVRNAIFFF